MSNTLFQHCKAMFTVISLQFAICKHSVFYHTKVIRNLIQKEMSELICFSIVICMCVCARVLRDVFI